MHSRWRAFSGAWSFVVLIFFIQGCSAYQPLYARAGFGMSTRTDPVEWANRLGAGWFLDWGIRAWKDNHRIDYWQMVRMSGGEIKPGLVEIQRLARDNPGLVWVIGNEPDNILQDNLPPEEFADFYHEVYATIKNADPTAKAAIGGVTQATPMRFEYLDRVLDRYKTEYGMDLPLDWWTIHAYVLREEYGSWGAGVPVGMDTTSGLLIEPSDHGSIELFRDQVIAFRGWMKLRGYQRTPLAVTEFGILLPERYGYTQDVVAGYLTDTFEWLDAASDPLSGYPLDDYHLVQRWAWFSLADEKFPVADLGDIPSGKLTPAGSAFQKFTTLRGEP